MGSGAEPSLKPVINLGNSIVGVSILAIPYCFAQCGVLLGLCLVVFNALLTVWSCKMLIRAANMTRSHTYETLALAVLGKGGKLAIELSIIALNIGTCIAYFVIIGDLAPPVLANLTGITISPNTLRALLLILSAVIIAFPLGLLRNVDSLSAISILSLLFYFMLTVEVICLSSGNIRSGVWRTHFVWWNNAGFLKQMFVIYSSLNDPGVRNMSKITERALCMILTLYLVVGLFGYITYCQVDIKGDILANFSLNFIAQLTRLGFAVSVVVSFPLMIFPCRASINSLLFSQAPNELHVQEPIPKNRFVGITAGIVGLTVTIAVIVPNIETVLGLTGATTGSLICFIFPGLLFLKVAGSSADFSNRAKLVLVIGLVSMVLSTVVILQSAGTQGEVVEVQPPVDVVANKPDIIKLPPVHPQVPEGEKKIDGKGANDKIQDEGGGDIVANGDKEQRKEPPLPQEVVDKPKVVEEKDIAKPVEQEKPVEPVKVDNQGDNVIDIPPDGGEAKQKPINPVLPDPNNQPAKEIKEKVEDHLKEEKQPQLPDVKDTGEQEAGVVKKREEEKAVVEDKAKESDQKDSPGEGGGVKKDDHKQLEKHLEKLSNRLDQLEEENRELREKQEVIQRIQIQQGEEQVAGNGEQEKIPPAQNVPPKELHQENAQDNANILKNSDNIAAVAKPNISNAAAALDIDRQEKAILEKEDHRIARGINEQLVNEHEQDIVLPNDRGEEGAAVVEPRQAAVGGNQPVEEPRAVGGDTNVEVGKIREGEKRDERDSKIEMAAVHQVEKDELGENAGNIAIAAPAADREKKSAGDENVPPVQDSVKYRKRDLKNANENMLSR